MMCGFAAVISGWCLRCPSLNRICASIKIQLYFFRIATAARGEGRFHLSSVLCLLSSVTSDDHSELAPLLPIPNRTVKRLSADDSVDYQCESRSSSDSLQTTTPSSMRALLFLGLLYRIAQQTHSNKSDLSFNKSMFGASFLQTTPFWLGGVFKCIGKQMAFGLTNSVIIDIIASSVWRGGRVVKGSRL